MTNDNRMKRTMRNAAILLGVFLLGLIPPLVRSMQLNRELAQARQALDLAATRDLAALTYLEVSRNNFGIAAQQASSLYERLQVLSQSGDGAVRTLATGALAKRDSVMGMLATADPAVRPELQDLTAQLLSLNQTEMSTRARSR
jgi:hypothetical protein